VASSPRIIFFLDCFALGGEGTTLHWNVGNHSPTGPVLHPRRRESSTMAVVIFMFLLQCQSFFCSVPQDIRILVPGAGLGRLAFEIARRGYTCQGNEFSLFMLFASNFMLNKWVCWFVHRNVWCILNATDN